MQSSLNKSEGLQRHLSVTVPAAEVAKHIEARTESLAKTVKIDGFRQGKVPAKIVKERMGDQLRSDVARMLVDEFLPKAVEEHKLTMAGQPSVAKKGEENTQEFKVDEGQDFEFDVKLEVYPTFTPKGHEKLELTREVADVTDAVVDESLNRLKKQLGAFAVKEGKSVKAEMGDRVTITGQGYTTKGGKEEAFAGGNLADFKVVLGSGSLIPGFEEGLVGTKKGDEVDVKVSFPAEYHAKELAGQPAVFKLTVDLIESQQEGELDAETLGRLGFENVNALKDIIRSGLERDLGAATEQRLKRQLLDALDAANAFDLPQSMVQAEHAALWRAQLQELQQRRLPMSALGESVDAAIASLKPLAERRVKLGLVMAEMAKANNLTVTNVDLENAVGQQIQAAGPQAEQARAYFANPANRQQLAGPILEDKVTGWLIEQAKVTEKKVDAQTLLDELRGE